MNTQRISWFWPLSFLAALGQFLLLLTGNEGGPAFGRFALAIWTLWLPGVWLGNLLTKPDTGLPARLPVQATTALGLAYLALQFRAAGWFPADALPRILAAGAMVIGLAFVVFPGSRGGVRRSARWETREVRSLDPQLLLLLLGAVATITALQLWAGSPLSLRPDGADHVAAARLAGELVPGFASPVYHDLLGLAGGDAHRSLAHAVVDLLARLSALPHHRVWAYLPLVASPLILLAVFAAGRAVFRNENLAAASVLAFLLIATRGLGGNFLRLTAYPDHLGLLPYWTGVALFLEGLDRPHLRGGLAFGLAALAATGTHLGFGLLLLAAMLVVGTFTWWSVDRFLEGVPLLLVLWLPAALLALIHVGIRVALLGGLEPFGVPAQGLWVLGPERWILPPPGGALTLAWMVGGLGVLVFLRTALDRVTTYYLVAAMVATALLAYNPLVLPRLERHLGALVHFLPWLAPLPFALVAEAEWAVRGITRSEGLTWLRILLGGALAVVVLAVSVSGLTHLAYTPGQRAAQRAAAPDRLLPLAQAFALAVPEIPTVLSDPVTTAALAAYTPARSAFRPATPDDPRGESLRRVLAAREAVPDVGDSARVAGRGRDGLFRFLRRYPVDAVFVNHETPSRLVDGWALSPAAMRAWENELAADSTRFRSVGFEPWGRMLVPAGAGPGPGPAGWLKAAPGPLRPPASTAFPAPRLIGVSADTVLIRAGDPLRLITRWRAPASGEPLDPRGYRVRVELRPARPASRSWLAGIGERWTAFVDRVTGAARSHATETPLAGGRAPARWFGPHAEKVVVDVPRSLAPGTYEVRVAALPGLVSHERYRRGLGFLPAGDPTVVVRIGPASR